MHLLACEVAFKCSAVKWLLNVQILQCCIPNCINLDIDEFTWLMLSSETFSSKLSYSSTRYLFLERQKPYHINGYYGYYIHLFKLMMLEFSVLNVCNMMFHTQNIRGRCWNWKHAVFSAMTHILVKKKNKILQFKWFYVNLLQRKITFFYLI